MIHPGNQEDQRQRLAGISGNKNKFSGNSMFEIGLDNVQIAEARKLAEDAGRKNPIFSDYTNARGKPLLMLHLLNLVDKSKDNDSDKASPSS